VFKGRVRDFPRTFDVGDQIWTLKFVNRVPDRAGKGRVLVGLACPMEQILYIRKELSPFDRLVVFLHEVQHALEDEYDFEIDHAVLNKLDRAQAQFLCDNFFGELSTKTRGKKIIKGIQNIFFRRFRRVKSCRLAIMPDNELAWHVEFTHGANAYIPAHGTIIRIGRKVITGQIGEAK
jgi:hypothetical protein